MELLLVICFLCAWGTVPRGRINEELGETSQSKIKDFLLDPHLLHTLHDFFYEPFLQLCDCFFPSVLGESRPLPAGGRGSSAALQQWVHGHGGAGASPGV